MDLQKNAARLEEITSAEVKYGSNMENTGKKQKKAAKVEKNAVIEKQMEMKKAMDEEMALELHRMYMEREDQQSKESNQMWHR